MGKFILSLNVFDYAISCLVVISVLIGSIRGFLKEIISLITWFSALFASLHFAPMISVHISFFSTEKSQYIASIVIIFFVVLLAGMLINFFAGKIVSTSGLGFFDRILGFGFGAARGLLVVIIVLLIIDISPYADATWLDSSVFAKLLDPLVHYFQIMVPKKMSYVVNMMQYAMYGN